MKNLSKVFLDKNSKRYVKRLEEIEFQKSIQY